MIVTISREYGAAGLGVAEAVAHALGYELLTDELATTVAARLGTSAHEVSARAAAQESLPERILGDLGAGSPESISPLAPLFRTDFDESLRRELERTIVERAAAGNVVILGRNAGALLGRRGDLVRVFLTAEREWRIGRVVESFGQTRDEARADLERIDAARRKIARDRYKVAFGDSRFYDLTLDVSRFGIDGAATLIVHAVRAPQSA